MPAEKKPSLLNNLSLKVIALVFGYTLWKNMSEGSHVYISLEAPLSFYNEHGLTVQAPQESVQVKLHASRAALYQLPRSLAIHINAAELQEGQNNLKINPQNLFLPDTVKLIDCTPKIVTVSVEKKVA